MLCRTATLLGLARSLAHDAVELLLALALPLDLFAKQSADLVATARPAHAAGEPAESTHHFRIISASTLGFPATAL